MSKVSRKLLQAGQNERKNLKMYLFDPGLITVLTNMKVTSTKPLGIARGWTPEYKITSVKTETMVERSL